MKTEVTQDNSCTIVAVSGTVDTLTAPDLAKILVNQIAEGYVNLVVDLMGVTFMSSAGLRTLLGALKESRSNGGDMRIASTNPEIERVLKISGFYNIARVYSSQAEAMSSFRS
jgi:anti-sigma B factor antagonist